MRMQSLKLPSLKFLTVFFPMMLWILFLKGCGQETIHHIIIETTPPGAKVFLEGRYLGVTPLSFRESRSQKNLKLPQRLGLIHEGYYEYQVTTHLSNVHHFTLIPHEKTVQLEFNLTPDFLSIESISYPPQKKVEVTLPLGEYDLFAYKENHPFLEYRLKVNPGRNGNVSEISQLKLAFSDPDSRNQLGITSVPEKVEVYYQNNLLGTTPMRLRNLSTESFSLVFHHSDFEERRILFKLNKKEIRNTIVRLSSTPRHRKIFFENFIPESQVIINGRVEVVEMAGGVGVTSVSVGDDEYSYWVSHSDSYLQKGKLINHDFSNGQATVFLHYLPRIPSQPSKILERPLAPYDTVQGQGGHFFLNHYDSLETAVYDLSFNLVNTYSFEPVGDDNSPWIMTGYGYSGTSLFRDRLLSSDQVYPFPAQSIGLISPVYLLPLSGAPDSSDFSEKQVVVFDNGDHRIKFFDLLAYSEYAIDTHKTVYKIVTARDYFTTPDLAKRFKQGYLLPLRFAQAIWMPSSSGLKMLFTDVVNRDLKTYDLNSGPGYFLSEFESQPSNPQAITSYHDLILVGDGQEAKVWVYDREGKFIHDFLLSDLSEPPDYLFIHGNRLYALGETASIYFLE